MHRASNGRRISFAGLAAISLTAAGCVPTPPPVVGPVVSQPVSELGQDAFSSEEAAEYRLRPADVIGVNVFREPDMSINSAQVGADGSVAIPLLGAVRARGRTTAELAEVIRSQLANGYLRDPRVAVNVIQYNSNRVTVEGAVKKPGVFTFIPGTRLSAAIALAEGPVRVAKLNQLAVFRDTEEGMTVAKFDYRAMQQGTMIDPVLLPGDRVVMGTSGLSQAWQDLLTALPAFALFTRI
jgi:polysaccharide export outer membrane protein